jgi:hypothetical protein
MVVCHRQLVTKIAISPLETYRFQFKGNSDVHTPFGNSDVLEHELPSRKVAGCLQTV